MVRPMPTRVGVQLTKSFSSAPEDPRFTAEHISKDWNIVFDRSKGEQIMTTLTTAAGNRAGAATNQNEPSGTIHTHQTAPTQFVEAKGIRFAYRRFGKAGGVPIVFNQHYTGTMDYWDPTVTDGLAKGREVILFNNAGVSSSSGEVPTTFEEMGANAIAFIKALGLKKVDVLGFSIGGFVAQEITLQAHDLVRRLVLVGTGPRGGQNMATLTPEAQKIFGTTYKEPEELWLKVHFTDSEASQAAGREFLKRFLRRTENRDPEVNEKVAPAQIEAIGKWGVQRKGSYEYLKTIRQPTLVVNGDHDVIIYSINSWILQQNMPNAQLIIYPDGNHGSQYQYPTRFVRHVSMFLSEEGSGSMTTFTTAAGRHADGPDYSTFEVL